MAWFPGRVDRFNVFHLGSNRPGLVRSGGAGRRRVVERVERAAKLGGTSWGGQALVHPSSEA
ncbi:hypothetical protein ACWEP3_11175, partial [Streptomyces albidoflavus]